MDNFDYDDSPLPEENPSKIRIIGRTIKYIIYAIVLIYISLLCLRVLSSGDTKIAKRFVWTSEAISAYEEDPDSFIVKAINIPEFYSEDGGEFYISNARFVESIGQFQASIRYNNSAIKNYMKKYDLENEPDGEIFVFTVSDNLGNIYKDYEYVKDSKNVLNYRRVVFSGINMTNVSTLTLNIYYINDVTLSKPYATLPLYNALKPSPIFDIEKELYKNNSVTEGLMQAPEYSVNVEPEIHTTEIEENNDNTPNEASGENT